MIDAERAAKTGKKVKKKKKKKKKKKGGKKGKGKKKKDPTADRALEHLYVEMVSNGILQKPLKVSIHARVYLCASAYLVDVKTHNALRCHVQVPEVS